MHLNKILEQIKRHQSPSEAIDKLSTALEKHEGSLLEKGFTILKSELAANMYEAINGPHFDEEHARYAVEGMENEDGTKGPHWTVEETTSVANQMGINLKSEKHNKWDWYVAMNMIYSDYYKAVVAMTGSANTKHFAELAKAWLCDKDIDEGKMWHYYVYLMCDDDENDYKAYERMLSVSDTDTATTLGICPRVWCQLPREGVMVFEARHTPAEASAELPVLISPTGSVSPAANTKNIPVVKADSSPLTGSEIAAGNRYFIYYNKCDNVMQIMNHYPTAAPAA